MVKIFANPAVGAEGFVFGAKSKPGPGLPLPIKPTLVKVGPVLVVMLHAIWYLMKRHILCYLRAGGPERSIYGSCMRSAEGGRQMLRYC